MSSDCPCCGDPLPLVRWDYLIACPDGGATWADRRFHLSPQHLLLLHHLGRRAPDVVRREALFLSSMNQGADDGVLTAQVSLLNKALRRHAVPLRIVTERALGYRLERTVADEGSGSS